MSANCEQKKREREGRGVGREKELRLMEEKGGGLDGVREKGEGRRE